MIGSLIQLDPLVHTVSLLRPREGDIIVIETDNPEACITATRQIQEKQRWRGVTFMAVPRGTRMGTIRMEVSV